MLSNFKRSILFSVIVAFCPTIYGQSIPFTYSVIAPEHSTQARAIGDIDGDGDGDIVLVEGEMKPKVLAWYEYPSWQRHDMNNEVLATLDYVADNKLADMDNDGDLDFIIPDSHNAGDKAKIMLWLENPRPKADPRSTWTVHIIKNLGTVSFLKEIAVGDLDRDGRMDAIARAEKMGYLFFQNRKNDWLVKEVPFRPHEGLEIADLDRDGDLDLILNGAWWENPAQSRTDAWTEHTFDAKWYNQNTGSWMDNNSQVRVGDINRDGLLDIVISSSEQKGFPVSWYQAPIDPKRGSWIEHVLGQLDYVHGLQVADMDNDGDLDVMAGEMMKGQDPDQLVVFVQEGHPLAPAAWRSKTPVFRPQVIASLGAYWPVIGDISGDGDVDIVSSRSYDKPPIEMWENNTSDQKQLLDTWSYITVDSTRKKLGDFIPPDWLRAFGLALGDVNNDGWGDIVSGREFYRNPGGDMSGAWQRIDLGRPVDASIIVDVDNDEFGDIIAQDLPNVYWYEAMDARGETWRSIHIGTIPATGHHNSQGFLLAQLIPGGKPEICLESGQGVYYFQIPGNPEAGQWPCVQVTGLGSHAEGIGAGDIDGDGLIDLALGMGWVGVGWWKNPGDGSALWQKYEVGRIDRDYVDKLAVADMNGDGHADIVVTEELYPDIKPACVYWFENPGNPLSDPAIFNWKRHLAMGPKFTLNNMSVADMDRDGDVDIITVEHKGDKNTYILENDGSGHFSEHLIARGKEGHGGAQVGDLDNDGDLDIVHICFEDFQWVHLLRNDAVRMKATRNKK